MRTVRAILAAALLAASPAAAQQALAPAAQSSPAPLAWLTGSWRGDGTMMGNASQATLMIRPVLGGRFVELSYRAGQFEGRAFYHTAANGSWQATWFDNRGDTFPIAASVAGTMLTANWGPENVPRGRTVYRLAEDGRLHITDSVLRPDGSYREFASHVLNRTE